MNYTVKTSMQLAMALKARRKTLNMTQKEAAALVGILPKTVSALENSPMQVSIASLYRYIRALNLDIVLSHSSQEELKKNGW